MIPVISLQDSAIARLQAEEQRLRAALSRRPDDVAALSALADVLDRLGRPTHAEVLLRRVLVLSPGLPAARFALAILLHRQARWMDALALVEGLLRDAPSTLDYQRLTAAVCAQLGDHDRAIGLYRAALAVSPRAELWLRLGDSLKVVGQPREAVAAFRSANAADPALGEGFWSIANLKTVRFTRGDIAAMEARLARPDLSAAARCHLHVALGKAMEDEARWSAAFRHYAKGKRLKRAAVPYDADETHALVTRTIRVMTAEFLADRGGWGHDVPGPIFVVGLPRSGSTLVEQILASHPRIEATMELPNLNALAITLAPYPDAVATLDRDGAAALGREYLSATAPQRHTDRPWFVDKLPKNFFHTGLIHLVLPTAKIVDVRRSPLACGVSVFKQLFAGGSAFANDLTEIGRYYRDYVTLMDHFDAVLPRRVHRVVYERLIADPEGEVRRLLAYVGVDFDPACLAFHENPRPVRTASAEQVRRPLSHDGLEQWRHFEPWLGPLRDALGDLAEP